MPMPRLAGPTVRAAASTLAALAACAAPALAQAPADTLPRDTVPVAVEGVVVTADRPAAIVGGAGAVVLRTDSVAVPPAPRLAEVLR
ncbi:MAG TPA: hypothetical protein VK399_01545, partial [Longimicrobiaceae bacterium]|nr:hypothetical protein [Longimicrobiaceae bacterium]